LAQLEEERSRQLWQQQSGGRVADQAEAATAINQRLNDVKTLIGAIGRGLSRLRQERAEQVARSWADSPATRDLYITYIAAKAADLAPVAALVGSYDALTRGGHGVAPGMVPLPVPAEALELNQFIAFVQTCRRAGLKVDLAKLPAAISARIEAGR